MNKQKPKTVALHTLGCKVNQYDTEAITEIFKDAGYELVDFDDNADIYVINTCTVTGLSARKSRQAIRRAKNTNKDAIVVVTGCYSQTAPGEVEKIPDVDIIIGTSERANFYSKFRAHTTAVAAKYTLVHISLGFSVHYRNCPLPTTFYTITASCAPKIHMQFSRCLP